MPQQSLLPDQPAMSSIRVEVKSFPLAQQPDEVVVTVSVGRGDGPPMPVWSNMLRGLERDLLHTLVSEAVSTYMYGERPRDVVLSCAAVKKMAQGHASKFDF